MTRRAELLLVAAAATLPFLGILGNPLLFDAPIAITGNEAVQKLPLGEALARDFWGAEPGTAKASGSWRPLVTLTWIAQARTVGNFPWLYHAEDLALHALSVALVFGLLGVAETGRGMRWAASLLFAWHPVVTEAVASAVGRADLLAAALLLGAALAYLKERRALAVALVFLSLFTKETAVGGPFVLIALAWSRGEGRRTLSFQAGCLAALAAYLLIRVSVLGALASVPMIDASDNPLVGASLAARGEAAAALLPLASRLLLFPVRLNHLYATGAIPLPSSVFDARVLCGGAIAIGLGILAMRRSTSLGACLVLLPLLPALHLAAPGAVLFAERWLYAPAAGLALLAATALPARRTIVAAAAAVALVFAAGSAARARAWRSMEPLVATSLDAYPATAKVWNERGMLLLGGGDAKGAERAFERAVESVPADPRPWYGLVQARTALADLDGAERAWRRLLDLAPPGAAGVWERFAAWQDAVGRNEGARATREEAARRFASGAAPRSSPDTPPARR